MVTGDKDSLQLITDHTMVKLVSTRMGQTTTKDMTEAAFREQYGFAPIHMIDLKALMGDSSDNIPGVPGIGEKTAMALIQQYESIDNLYARMPDIDAKPAAIRKLAEGEESARESYWLATIVTDAPLDFRPEDNLVQKPGPDAYPLFLKLEFTKLIEKFGLAPAERRTAEKPSCHHDRGAGDGPGPGGAPAGPVAAGGPRGGAGPAGPDGPLRGLLDRGGHRRHGGAVLREVPGGLERPADRPVLGGHPQGLPQREGPDADAAGKPPPGGGVRVRHGPGRLPAGRHGGEL